jgi:hypothetical protein
MADIGRGQKLNFSMDGMASGQKVVVKCQFQHGRETAKIMNLHGSTKIYWD